MQLTKLNNVEVSKTYSAFDYGNNTMCQRVRWQITK